MLGAMLKRLQRLDRRALRAMRTRYHAPGAEDCVKALGTAGEWGAVWVAIGLTRPYLGMHYPSDVLGGAALGLVIGRLWPGIRAPDVEDRLIDLVAETARSAPRPSANGPEAEGHPATAEASPEAGPLA